MVATKPNGTTSKAANGHKSISDVESERLLIGCVFRVPDVFDDVAQMKPEHFYDSRHQLIWKALAEVHDSRQAVHPVAVAESLARDDQLVAAGDVKYLADICDHAPDHATHAESYAGFVLKKWRARHAVWGCRDVQSMFDDHADEEVIAEKADQVLTDIAEAATPIAARSIRDTLAEVVQEVTARLRGKKSAGLLTGFTWLDNLLVGMLPHELIVLAARPGVGKSAFACSLALNVAMAGGTVSFHSLEMSQQEICERWLCSVASLDGNALKSGYFGRDELERERILDNVLRAVERLQKLQIFIDDNPNQKLRTIAATSRRLKRKKHLNLIIVDYLQLVEPRDIFQISREQQVAQISRALKGLAKELQVPVVVLAQLNREIEKRTDKTPHLSDLRESGAIEQDADVVMFLNRPAIDDPNERPGECDVIVRKNRRGPTGTATLAFIPERTMFGNLSREDEATIRGRSNSKGWQPYSG